MRVFLLGYMGSGKSTLGPKVAGELSIPFLDLDDVFEERYRISISNFFRKYGEHYFRKIEQALLQELTKQEEFLLATGGGTPCYYDNLDFMKQHGITVYLRLPFEVLIDRLICSQKKRPVIGGIEDEKFANHIREHLKSRELFYLQSDLIVDPTSFDPGSIAGMIKVRSIRSDGV